MTRMARFLVAATAAVGGLAVGAGLVVPPAGATPSARPARVLVVMAPTLTAADLRSPGASNLRRFFDAAAVAACSTRVVDLTTTAGDGYVALGAGARARARAATAGTNVDASEFVDGPTGAAAFAARTGRTLPDDGVGVLAIDTIRRQNDALPYDSEVGALAGALERSGYSSAVVANADDTRDAPRHREAALAFMNSGGVARGTVSDALLRVEPAAPFGLTLDSQAALTSFDAAWRDRAVVGVELSDLARAARARQGQADALARSDALFALLMTRVDLSRDLVVLVGSYPPPGDPQLTVVALQGPGVTPGWLVSATTRRAGYVALTDVAPTVLDRLGVARPTAMEGRPMRVEPSTDTAAARLDLLVRANAQAQFRDRTIGPATDTLWILTLLVAIAAAIWLPTRSAPRRAVAVGALTIPGALLGTYLAMLFPVERWGAVSYWVIVAVVALAFTGIIELAAQGDPWKRTLIAFGALGGFHLMNQFIGGPLEINAVFGYNATVGVRVQGLGNQSFSQLAPCALVVATMVLVRPGGRAGRALAWAALLVTVVVNGAPWWGADFGGVLAEVIAFGCFAWMVTGRRIKVRTVVFAGIGAALLGVALGLLDLARPAGQRTHIGRLFERVHDDGVGGFATVIGRKAELMLATFSNLVYVSTLVVVIVVLVVLWRRQPSYGRALEAAYPPMRALLVGLALLGFFGMVLNDSGASIPGMMAMVVIAAIATMAPRELDGDADRSSERTDASEEGNDVLLPQ
ncbi:MAG: hypothetical protein ACOYNI_03720 [Acidimicrobiia bacterium]